MSGYWAYDPRLFNTSSALCGPPLPNGGHAWSGLPIPPPQWHSCSAADNGPPPLSGPAVPAQGKAFFDRMPRPGAQQRRKSYQGVPQCRPPSGPNELPSQMAQHHAATAPQPTLYDIDTPADLSGGPQIRVGQIIPVGKGFMLDGEPLAPLNGPRGYGVYIESAESADIVDLYPCEKQREVLAAPRLPRKRSSSHAPRLQRHGQLTKEDVVESVEPSYIPFDLPPPQKAVDPVDPKWKAMFVQLAMLDKDNLGSIMDKERLFMDRIMPMMKYIRSLPGGVAEGYHERLVEKVKDLGMRADYEDMRPRRWGDLNPSEKD